MSDRQWRWGVAVIVAVSLVAHLWKLGLRPLAHDEAIDAWFSWQARHWGVMRYDPVYHGPLRFYLEGPVLAIFGVTAGWARLVAALAGVATTALIAGSRRVLGMVGSLAAALVFTISPTVLTVTRTGREDSLVALVSVAMLVVVADALRDVRPRHLIAMAALVAISFGLKETTFIFGFAGACFFVVAGLVAFRRPDGAARRFYVSLGAIDRYVWMWTVIAFVGVFLVIFTSMFRYPAGFESGLLDGIRYWWGQHEVGRGSQRWFFYLTIYAAYEWLLIGLAVAGMIATVRRRSLVGAWFATMSGVQLLLYSWAGEKFAWLALHPLLPMILLAGLGVEAIARAVAERSLDATSRSLIVAGCGLALVGTVAIAIPPAITDGADPSELLVTVQTTTAVPDISERLASAVESGTVSSILVDERDSGAWPWVWYLHPLDGVEYQTLVDGAELPEGFDAYIVATAGATPPEVPVGYDIERFPLRAWWLPDYDDVGLGDIASWLASRQTWNPTGSTDQYLIIRSDAVR